MLPPLLRPLLRPATPQQPHPSPAPSPVEATLRVGVAWGGRLLDSGASLLLAPINRVAPTTAAVIPLALRFGSSHIHRRVEPVADWVGGAAGRVADPVGRVAAAGADRMERSATFATSPAGLHLGTSFLGYGVGAAIDPVAAPARATIAPDLPLVREQFARHPEDMAKGALIGASLISAALVPGTLFFGGRGAAAAAGPATSGAIRTGGGAAMGFAARTAPITVPEGAILGGAALAAVIGSRAASPAWRSVNIPSGLPDWMDKWNDPHGGAGTGGKEIPRPDWMSGDPEITIDPGVDWRAPGESFQNYLRYRRELPREGPPGTGPTPYYSGPEIARPGAATRSIDSPELFIGGRTFRSPEIKIGAGSRTIHSPEIEVRDPARRFGSELPLRPGRDIFPPELPKSKEYEAFKFPGEWDRRPGVDRFIPELPKTKYADALLAAGSMTIGRGKFRRIPRNVPAPGKIIDGRDTYDLGGLPRDAPVLDVWGETLKVEALKDLSADTVYARMPRGPEVAPRFTIDVFGRPNRLLENLTRTLPDLESGTLTRPDAGTVTKAKTSMGTRTVTVPSITSLVFGSFAPGLTTLNVPEVEYPDPPRLKNPPDYPGDYPPPGGFGRPYEFNFLDETRRRRKCKKDGKKRDATATPGSFGFEETLTLPDLSHLWRF